LKDHEDLPSFPISKSAHAGEQQTVLHPTMPRFVILTHDWPVPHWDLFLEQGEVLRAWRLEVLPAPEQEIAAEAIADHRRLYLDYEGPVSGGRGSVSRWDHGDYELIAEAADGLTLRLRGRKIDGIARLSRRETPLWILSLTCWKS
jgi:hypothetical protein